jgi:hypothetical protein
MLHVGDNIERSKISYASYMHEHILQYVFAVLSSSFGQLINVFFVLTLLLSSS